MWYIYTVEYYSAIKKWNNAIYSNMDGPRDYHTKWSQSKTSIVWYRLYAESKKNDTNELIYKTEINSQRMKLWLPKGKDWGGREG